MQPVEALTRLIKVTDLSIAEVNEVRMPGLVLFTDHLRLVANKSAGGIPSPKYQLP